MTRIQYTERFKTMFPSLADDISEVKMMTGNKGIMLRSKTNKAKWYTFTIFSNGDWSLTFN